ncbi:DUF1707 SHOCT-like domain-containing protein [Actinomycetospora termitidis]|uniref:DUF1707 domain-containing protein n=1 Tax=Actinomycetospora termitidis TaxID=3053470 RepID=A0ABT7MFU0_9PSEU|nr:DUF1707 domain-containing protein [Actinomycetospora sp. Odt1-22]MDL5158747.1 DUF1707 domain-containing protein [Actinomycetospora sp. Odt1-22]
MDDDHAGVPAEPARLRVGHDERTAAMKALDEHLEAGRLDVAEYSDRSATAGAAVYRDELDVLFRDLPEPHLAPAGAAVVPTQPRLPERHAARALAVIPILLAVGMVVLVVTGNGAGFVLFPLVFLLMGTIGHRHRRF